MLPLPPAYAKALALTETLDTPKTMLVDATVPPGDPEFGYAPPAPPDPPLLGLAASQAPPPPPPAAEKREPIELADPDPPLTLLEPFVPPAPTVTAWLAPPGKSVSLAKIRVPAPPPPPIAEPPAPPPPTSRMSALMSRENAMEPGSLNWYTLVPGLSVYTVGEPVTLLTRPYVHRLQADPEPSPPVPAVMQVWQAESMFSL